MKKKTIQKNPKHVLLSAGLISLFGIGLPQTSLAVPVVNSVVQNGSITGIISDTNGDPIIGASIMVKGTTGKGAITDLDGRFTIKDVKDATLVISYIGFVSQEVKAQADKVVNITLKEDSKVLNDVVVVGYGTQ